MSRWKETFDNHPVHESLDQLRSWLDVDSRKLDENCIEEMRRASKALGLLKNGLKQLDAEVVPFSQLDALNNQLRQQNIWNQVQAFSSKHTYDHIKTANEAISALLHFPALLGAVSSESLDESATSAVEFSLQKLSRFISTERQKQDQQISSLTERINELEQKKEKLDTVIETRRQEVDQQLSQWQQQFSEAQEKRSESFSNWRDEVSSEVSSSFDELENSKKAQMEKLQSETKKSLDALVEESKEKNQRIRDLYELTSGDSISGGYAKTAEEESTQANHWRIGSVVFICLTAIWLVFAYSQFERAAPTFEVTSAKEDSGLEGLAGNARINWPRVLMSVSLTGVLLFGAAFCSQQSNRHRSEAKSARAFALQIKALDPYISSLEKSDQVELKKKLTEIYFVGSNDDSSSEGSLDPHAVSVISKAINDALKASRS